MYPLGTRYDPMAPWNAPLDPPTETCKSCRGRGHIWYAYHIEKDTETPCSEETYNILPDTEEQAIRLRQHFIKGNHEICPDCDGKGEVITEYYD